MSKDSFKYPREPNGICEKIREACLFDYVKLLEEKIIPHKKNLFKFIPNISI